VVLETTRYAEIMSRLLRGTYGADAGDPLWAHPHGALEDGVWAHVDRVGFRVADDDDHHNEPPQPPPERRRRRRPAQRSLTPHLDCCPDAMHRSPHRWRPIQCLLALSGGLGPDEGGFECVPGFHREFGAYYEQRASRGTFPKDDPTTLPCVGDFIAVSARDDAGLLRRFRHIRVPPGAALFWDRRIPHANARRNTSRVPRRVLYGGFLPRGPPLNAAYARAQLARLRTAAPQPDFWIDDDEAAPAWDGDDDDAVQGPAASTPTTFLATLSPHARRLLGVDEFDEVAPS